MAREKPDKDPTPDDANIRSGDERYGGEGHAGTDPFAPPKSRHDRTGRSDSSVELPNATHEDLNPMPATAEERAEDDSGLPGGPVDPEVRKRRAENDKD